MASAIGQAAGFARAGLHSKMEKKMAELHARERTEWGDEEPESSVSKPIEGVTV